MTSSPLPAEDLLDLYDAAPCGYVSITPRACIAKINRTLADWVLRSPDELVGESIHDILSFGGKIAFETHLAPMLRLQNEVHEIALDLQNAHGEKIPVIGNAREKRGPSGEHLFTRLTLFKAVERRTFERSLIEAKIRAEERFKTEHDQLELRDQFIAVLGHDLRNPLAAVGAGIRLLGKQPPAERRELILNEMQASISRANDLIDDVLDFAMGRLGTGIQLDYPDQPKLEAMLRQVLHEIQTIAPAHKIVCALDDLDEVECDPDRIGQLASNLLSNAVKYGDRERPIKLESRIEGELLQLSVANHGNPIPEHMHIKLFQPFERGLVTGGAKGLGLGLFIVNEIAIAHGGKMSVSSSDEETRFTLTMPVKKPDAACSMAVN
ncbi:PAS domain-containing sensor histidine kinase [Sphingopyxis sp. JAI128]|uniref:sensor histidine kinase n=1 Tax=Sphingopyxis sp. JAI128 TaxID=2723066 RepID=UPI001797725C|nr:PAS domain-containing sensor histidine kinase [Sphingopyxis sp. JAI128]MBB6425791.1 sigma-B regulation protein RsbU (phosphoserine phosphatase) [Sphingopyxis sp. JAI128]